MKIGPDCGKQGHIWKWLLPEFAKALQKQLLKTITLTQKGKPKRAIKNFQKTLQWTKMGNGT